MNDWFFVIIKSWPSKSQSANDRDIDIEKKREKYCIIYYLLF